MNIYIDVYMFFLLQYLTHWFQEEFHYKHEVYKYTHATWLEMFLYVKKLFFKGDKNISINGDSHWSML